MRHSLVPPGHLGPAAVFRVGAGRTRMDASIHGRSVPVPQSPPGPLRATPWHSQARTGTPPRPAQPPLPAGSSSDRSAPQDRSALPQAQWIPWTFDSPFPSEERGPRSPPLSPFPRHHRRPLYHRPHRPTTAGKPPVAEYSRPSAHAHSDADPLPPPSCRHICTLPRNALHYPPTIKKPPSFAEPEAVTRAGIPSRRVWGYVACADRPVVIGCTPSDNGYQIAEVWR